MVKGFILLKKLFYMLFVISITFTSLNAAAYKGQALFQKMCLDCHGKALEFVIAKDTPEWTKLMEDKGSPLLLIHVKSSEAEESWKYFKGKRFPKHVRHYKDFFLEYAADTGNIPACD